MGLNRQIVIDEHLDLIQASQVNRSRFFITSIIDYMPRKHTVIHPFMESMIRKAQLSEEIKKYFIESFFARRTDGFLLSVLHIAAIFKNDSQSAKKFIFEIMKNRAHSGVLVDLIK